MATGILQHVPTWVFGLLIGLIALGVSQAAPRTLSLRRSAALPLVLLGVSLMGVLSTFAHQPAALLAWTVGLAGAVAALHSRVDTSRVRFSAATQQFAMPGSWVPLALMLGLFVIKFGVGMSLASHPALRESTLFALSISTSYGAFSGVFLGRAVALWTLARRQWGQPA